MLTHDHLDKLNSNLNFLPQRFFGFLRTSPRFPKCPFFASRMCILVLNMEQTYTFNILSQYLMICFPLYALKFFLNALNKYIFDFNQ